MREVVLSAGDTVALGAHRVTVPLRTAVDIARTRQTFGASDRDAVRRLAELAGFGLADCRDFMERSRNLPAKRRALERLGACLG